MRIRWIEARGSHVSAQVAAAWAAKGGDVNLMDQVMMALKTPPSPDTASTLALIAEARAQMATGAANGPQVRHKKEDVSTKKYPILESTLSMPQP